MSGARLVARRMRYIEPRIAATYTNATGAAIDF